MEKSQGPTDDFVQSMRNSISLGWKEMPARARCRIVGSSRRHIAEALDSLVDAVASAQRTKSAETFAAELVPLCDALLYLEKSGPKILRSRRPGWFSRPLWMWGTRAEVQRVPRGVILIIGTWNYPLLLAGVQAAQALAAGNGVLWKPAPGCERATEMLAQAFWSAGVPEGCLKVLGSEAGQAISAMQQGVDLVVLTGAAETGKKVLRQAAETLTPVVLELSGCDACVILPGADLDQVVTAYKFGLTLNSGATCIAPRRLMVHRSQAEGLLGRLSAELNCAPDCAIHPAALAGVVEALRMATAEGASTLNCDVSVQQIESSGRMPPVVLRDAGPDMQTMNADIFGPVSGVVVYDDVEQTVPWINQCPYGLSASVFGPQRPAEQLAERLEVGSVVINDLIAPTADPRLPFGGRRRSGFGVTRGDEGLLEMTIPRVLITRTGGPRLHLKPQTDADVDVLGGLIRWQHGLGMRSRFAGLRRLLSGVNAGRRQK